MARGQWAQVSGWTGDPRSHFPTLMILSVGLLHLATLPFCPLCQRVCRSSHAFLMPLYCTTASRWLFDYAENSCSSFQAEIIRIRGQGENFPTQKGNDVALLSGQPKL